MATVFEAQDLKHNRKVAIKVLDRHLGATLNAERFLQEIRVTAGLHHPHILPLHDSGAFGNLVYYVMPFVDDGSLRDLLVREKQLSVAEAVRIASQVAGALDHAHRQGFIHRDIKPANILIQDGEALVADFGIAHALERTGDDTLTGPGESPGTPHYMSPEQVRGEPLDQRSDIFSLGCVLYEMLAGERPYAGGKLSAMANRVSTVAPPISNKRPDVPAHVGEALAHAMAREPDMRFQRASDFARALERRAGEEPLHTNRIQWRSRTTVLAAGALGVCGIVALGLLTQRRSARVDPLPPISAAAIAVFPFEIYGTGDIQYLREGVPDLLSTNLNGAGDIRSVDSRALLSALRQRGVTTPDAEDGRALATRFGAATFVLGSVAVAGNRLRIRARLLPVDTTNASTEEAMVEGDGSQLFALLDSLTTKLIAGRSRSPGDRLVRTASVTTASLPALKAYLVGTKSLRGQQFVAAVAAFEEAARLDTTFALAYYGLSLAAENATQADVSRASAEKAMRHAGRLSARDRTLVEALGASRRGDVAKADSLYNEILASSPEDVEAWFQLGEVRFHFGPRIGDPIERAVEPFRQVLNYEPDNTLAAMHLARLAGSAGNLRLLDSLATRITALAPQGDVAIQMKVLRAFAHRDSAEIRRMLGELSKADDIHIPFITWQLAAYLHDLPAAERVLRIGTNARRDTAWRALAYSILAHIEVGRGRWASAQSALDSMSKWFPVNALEHRVLLSLAPFVAVPESQLRLLRDSLQRITLPPVVEYPGVTSLLTVDVKLHPHIRAYLLGLVSARLGETDVAMRSAHELDKLGGDDDARALARDFARSVRAAAQRTPTAMLSQLEQLNMRSWYEFAMYSAFISLAHERFSRAMLLAAANRDAESVKWFSSFSDFSFFDVRYAAPANLERARLWRRHGRKDVAAAYYRQFLNSWRDADPQFQPALIQARKELAEISGR